MTDDKIRDILTRTRRIALVGASANPARASHGVMRFLLAQGYDVVPVNPGLAGQDLLGQPVIASLNGIEGAVDMIDIFRAPEHVPGIVDEALAMSPQPATIWMQLDVIHEQAAQAARDAGLDVVMDRCPAIEYPRLFA